MLFDCSTYLELTYYFELEIKESFSQKIKNSSLKNRKYLDIA